MEREQQLKTAFNVVLKDMLDKFGYCMTSCYVRDIIINETVVLLLDEVDVNKELKKRDMQIKQLKERNEILNDFIVKSIEKLENVDGL